MTAYEVGEVVLANFRQLPIARWRENPHFVILMEQIASVIYDNSFLPLASIEAGMDLDRASGYQLDLIGDRLGFSRPLSAASALEGTSELFGMRDEDGTPAPSSRARGFDQAPFYSIDPLLSGRSGVSDGWYRRMLRGRAASIFSQGTKAEVEAAGAAMGCKTVATAGVSPSASLVITEDIEAFYNVIVRRENLEMLFGIAAGVSVTTTRATT